jgi:uncharacterized RDD family membrane protein YckC
MPDEEIRVPAGLTTDGLLGRRYMARIIDSVILFLLILPVMALEANVAQRFVGASVVPLLVLPINVVVWIGYGAILESSQWQATLGKRLMGLRVYNSNGGRLSLRQSAGRNLVKDGPFLAIGAIPGGQLLALIWLGAHLVVMHRSPVYQAIHDRVAHTWVAAPEETTQLHIA